jgi:16S rRNA (cytidine1402-2'-O)-methyltransferase
MIRIFGDRQACLTREITKIHEEYARGSLSDIFQRLDEKETIKGECSLFVQGCGSKEVVMDDEMLEKVILDSLASSDLGTSDLARQIAEEYLLSKKKVYEIIIKLNEKL